MLAWIFAFVLSASAQQRFDVSDVSFLFPIEPMATNPNYLLRFDSQGSHGPLLSRESAEEGNLTGWDYEQWAITAVRFEPCAEGDKENPATCKSELRLTAQRFLPNVGLTGDSIHLVYRVEAANLGNILSSLRQLKKSSHVSTNGVPLGIHPALRDGNSKSAYYKNLIHLILDFAGEEKLIRVAVTFEQSMMDWTFQGKTVRNGRIIPDPIPNIGQDEMMLDFVANNGGSDEGSFSPVPSTPVTILPLFQSQEGIESAVKDGSFFQAGNRFAKSAEYAATVENPMLGTHIRNTDCATCHVASRAASFTKGFFDQLQTGKPFPWMFDDLKFKLAGYTLTNNTSLLRQPDTMTAFGYDRDDGNGGNGRDEVTIIQRVINESAMVADWINRH